MPDHPSLHRGPEHGPAGTSQGRLSVAELLYREGRIEEPAASGSSSRTYRVLAVTAGIVLVCAVVVASTAALAGPRVERALPATGVLEHITGAGVLRPDLINTTIGPAPVGQSSRTAPETGNGTSAPPETTGTPPPDGRSLPSDDATGTDDGAADGSATDGTAPSRDPSGVEGGTGEPADPTTESAPDQLPGVVRTFYQQVVTDPANAYAMLGPGMRGTGYRAFAESWSGVERVTVDSIRSDGRDAVVVAVVVERADGSVLRSVQRMVMDTTGSPRIESARLLSASTS